MITDTEIKAQGVEILATHMGDIEMERFIALIQREPFDYTQWHQKQNDDMSIEEISQVAMALRKKMGSKQANGLTAPYYVKGKSKTYLKTW